jgi:hypothetical protein
LAAVISVGPAFARAPLAKHDPTLFQIQPAATGISLEVVDSSGTVVSNARVTIVNEKTKVKVYGGTDAKGQLRLVDLPAGNYEVTVALNGFKLLNQSHVSVPTKTPLRLQMEVGASMGALVVLTPAQAEPKDAPICKTLSNPPSDKPK